MKRLIQTMIVIAATAIALTLASCNVAPERVTTTSPDGTITVTENLPNVDPFDAGLGELTAAIANLTKE
jgi:hypothetical protein